VATQTLIPRNPPLFSPVLNRMEQAVSPARGTVRRAASHLLASPGKLLRPTLVLLAAQAAAETRGFQDGAASLRAPGDAGLSPGLPEAVYDFAAAVELVHVASLIHDDVIDGAATRRSLPSVNAGFGNHTAVLAGDYLFAAAFRLLAPHAARGAVTLMTDAISRMCHGEVMQEESLFDPGLSEEAYLERVRAKTASLLAAACEGGARLAGAGEELCRAFRAFGESLGLAFQIADDILDLEETPQQLGKPACADLRQGVITLPVIRLLAHPEWSARLAPRIRARRIDDELIAHVQEGLKRTGALESAREEGFARARKAAARLEPVAWTRGGAALLELSRGVMLRRR